MVRFLLTSLLVLATTGPALAQEVDAGPVKDLLGDAMTTVVVVPGDSAILVTHEYRFTNGTTDAVFTGFFETLPRDAVDVVATSGGEELTAVGIPALDGFWEWLVRFPEPLTPAEERDVVLTWRRDGLTSDPNDLAHVSANLVAIAPYGVEHRATSRLRIEIPGRFDVVESSGLAVRQEEDLLILETDETGVTEGYVAVPIVVEAPDRFSRSPILGFVGEITVATADPRSTWLVEGFEVVLNGLSAAIPLDPPTPVEFRQGYTGGATSRSADDGVIVLPFDADAVDAGREYAATWLTTIDFADDELRLALSGALADRIGVDANLPVSSRSGGWTAAVDALISVSDESTMSTVVAALDAGVPVYAGVDDEFSDVPVDWRRLTDVFQHIGGVQAAPAAMRLSATGDQLTELARRDSALVDYEALAERAAPWAMPPLLRTAMATWDFDEMAERQGSVSDLIVARDEMVAAADSVDLEIGPYVQAEFERASLHTDDAWALLAEQREALDVVAGALRLEVGDRGLLSSLGMWGLDADVTLSRIIADWNAGDFDAATHDAEELLEDYEASVGRGTLRLVAPLAALSVVALAVQILLRRRHERQERAQP